MATKRAYKTVAFFEIRDENESEIEAIDWQDLMSSIDAERVAASNMNVLRHEFNGAGHYVQVYTYHNEYHLVLAKEREEPPSSLNVQTGQFIDEEEDANQPWVEVSVIKFFPGSNVFGLVMGSGASPRASALSYWLNAHESFEDSLTVAAHLSDELLERLRKANSQARLVSLKLNAQQIAQTQQAQGIMSQFRQFGRELDLGSEVEMEVIVKIKGRVDSATSGVKDSLGAMARSLIDGEYSGASVEMLDEVNGQAERELVDLVNFRMTTKERVSILNDDGSQVRIPSAINAINRAAYKLNIEGARGDG